MTATESGRKIVKLIDTVVTPIGFTRKGQKWDRACPETLCRLDLRKRLSRYNLEIWVSVIQLNQGPELVWHIFGSMFSPSVEEKIEWEKCLDTRMTEVSGKARETRLLEILREKIVPLLRSFESLEGITNQLHSGRLRGMGVRTELQNLTGYRA
jgi:hypothetical protein